MPVQYPTTLASEDDLIALLAELTAGEMHLLLVSRVWPAIKLNAGTRSRGRPGPLPHMANAYQTDGRQLSETEFKRQSQGAVLWQLIEGQWAKVEKTVIGHKAYWGIVERAAEPPFDISP